MIKRNYYVITRTGRSSTLCICFGIKKEFSPGRGVHKLLAAPTTRRQSLWIEVSKKRRLVPVPQLAHTQMFQRNQKLIWTDATNSSNIKEEKGVTLNTQQTFKMMPDLPFPSPSFSKKKNVFCGIATCISTVFLFKSSSMYSQMYFYLLLKESLILRGVGIRFWPLWSQHCHEVGIGHLGSS